MPSSLMNGSISTAFMTTDTQLPPYLPYPVFLMDMKISLTAKAVYALLLRRSNLSQLNQWEDELGRVYIIYPIDAIAADLHKGRTTIKKALHELEDSNLLERHHETTGGVNYLYVKLPEQSGPDPPCDSSRMQDFAGGKQTLSPVRNRAPAQSGNSPPDSRISDPDPGSFPPPSNKKDKNNIKDHSDAMIRITYGRYGNIFLSDKEYEALLSDYADELPRYIDELSCYLAASGRTYKNYEAGIRSWASRDYKKKQTENQNKYDYSEEDSL